MICCRPFAYPPGPSMEKEDESGKAIQRPCRGSRRHMPGSQIAGEKLELGYENDLEEEALSVGRIETRLELDIVILERELRVGVEHMVLGA